MEDGNGRATDLGEKDSCTYVLVIPPECVVVLTGSESLPVDLDVLEEDRVPCGLEQPSCSPQQLILRTRISFISVPIQTEFM